MHAKMILTSNWKSNFFLLYNIYHRNKKYQKNYGSQYNVFSKKKKKKKY